MGHRLNEVKFDEGRLVGLMKDGSRVQLESVMASIVYREERRGAQYMPTNLKDMVNSFPENYYVHVESTELICVFNNGVEVIPYIIFRGRKIEDSQPLQTSQ